ncbi:B44 [miniopterid betaherpesvirus 1]|uniref:DNA polymerase processivity factor n=1 Tax=miniopterid betaherpesvirus 1 TaxID=3070189 RepID=I3VQ29_9BETA|nr:B44 [miniopterid betaherpesvirus 1]AFK83873.1 B44 [miniopterid betaherpesvirus 1]
MDRMDRMDRLDRLECMDRMERKVREKEPPTLALRLKPYKTAIQQLRSVLRTLKENTTVTFLPTPAMVLQTVRVHYISKITFNSSCLYITNKMFQPKTINNSMPVLGNFIYTTSSKDLTRFYVQDTSDLSARVHMSAPDFTMDVTSACVHGQDIIRENGDSSSRVDLDITVIYDLIKWLAPHTRVKRNVKRQSVAVGTVQILMHANPPTLKFALGATSEMEFTAGSKVSFHEVKSVRATVSAKNFYQALLNCAVTKLSCTIRFLTEHELMVYVASKSSVFSVENFLTEEQQFARGDVSFERPLSHRQGGGANGSQMNEVNDGGQDGCSEVPVKRHERSSNRKLVDQDHPGPRDKYEQNKITSYMTAKTGSSGGERSGYFGDAKEESDSDSSVSFEFAPSSKKQKC